MNNQNSNNKIVYENINFVNNVRVKAINDKKLFKVIEEQKKFNDKPLLFVDRNETDRILREKLMEKMNEKNE